MAIPTIDLGGADEEVEGRGVLRAGTRADFPRHLYAHVRGRGAGGAASARGVPRGGLLHARRPRHHGGATVWGRTCAVLCLLRRRPSPRRARRLRAGASCTPPPKGFSPCLRRPSGQVQARSTLRARRQVQARSTLRARRHGDARLLTAVLLCAAGAMRFRVRVCVRVCVRVRVRVRALLCISAHVHQHAQPGLDSSGRAGERGAIPPPLPTVLAVRLFALMSVSVSIADAEPREADAGRHQGRSACANVYV